MSMQRRQFCRWVAGAAGTTALPWILRAAMLEAIDRPQLLLMDMVHFNPGEPAPATHFLDPGYIQKHGFGAQVIQSPIEGTPTFDVLAPGLIPQGSRERTWAERTQADIQKRIQAAHDSGLRVYAWMQLVVLPKTVLRHFCDEICDSAGHIDVERPRTRQLIAAQLNEIFDKYPLLDGLVIRTGEVYLQDLPFHASSGDTEGTKAIQKSTAILNGQKSHLALLEVLRGEVCVRRNRRVFYRTWDFGHFHTEPSYYLGVTDKIEVHPNLVFSIKHQAGDFHQLTPFNPTLTIGRHPQIVEVQCQREAYGKGAHPYYIGQGIIDGWEDMAWINSPGWPRGLRDIQSSSLFAGIWTWSRGGGWEGPYIKNELWCTLNALVMSEWTLQPRLSEREAFCRAARSLGVDAMQTERLRQIALLSTKAVLRGQLTALPSSYSNPIKIDLWWARDDKLENPDLRDFIRRNIVEQSIAEKNESVRMWRQIVALSDQTWLGSPNDTAFMRSSCQYGLMKYSIIAVGWTAILLAQESEVKGGSLDPRVATCIRRWDTLWKQWHAMAAADPLMSTLVRPQGFDLEFKYKPGLGAAIDALRLRIAKRIGVN